MPVELPLAPQWIAIGSYLEDGEVRPNPVLGLPCLIHPKHLSDSDRPDLLPIPPPEHSQYNDRKRHHEQRRSMLFYMTHPYQRIVYAMGGQRLS